ncbi:MAG TPA: VWA domain-containing protein [Kofleriaceae bacterium]|nr:VWA domain-containing protein [Kofleriaceae bacterium]
MKLVSNSIGSILVLMLAGCGGGASDGNGGNVGFGGAQDIGQFRGILEAGGIPGVSTLDANGFFNEHYIELPPPECGQLVCGHAMVAVGRDWVGTEYQAAVQIGLNTTIDPTTLERMPLNLVVVVDTSGSMAEDDRIGFVRAGLHLLIDELQPGDRLGLVEYNTDARILAPLGDPDRETLHALASALRAQGGTNFYGGLETGLGMVADAFDLERQNRVVLLSDGQPTAGITDLGSIIAMAEGYISDGIGLTTVGVGQSFNVELMRGLAERGAGNFYYLEDADAVEEVFTDELDYFVSPIALEVDIEMIAGDAYSIGEVVGTKLWKSEGDSGRVHLPALFVASRTSDAPDPNGRRGGGSTIVAQMLPRSGATSIEPEKMSLLRLSYRLPGATDRIEQLIEVTNPNQPGEAPEDVYLSHEAMAKTYAAYNIFLGLRAAAREAETDYHCALSTLDATASATAIWNQRYEDPDIAADQGLIDQFRANLQARGAVGTACGTGPYGGGYDDHHGGVYACSSTGRTGSTATLLLLLCAAVVAARRR